MKDFLLYILYAGICQILFWAVYQFMLSKTTFFAFNRIYLIIGLMVSFILPAFVIKYDVIIPVTAGQANASLTSGASDGFLSAINGWMIVGTIYLIGLFIVFIRNIKSYFSLRAIWHKGKISECENCKVVENEAVGSSFTFFNRIYLNTNKLSDVEKDLIIKHEKVHIRYIHYLDLICCECALLLQWFNPFVWLYVSSIKENHEFQADQAVIQKGVSPDLYRAVLINQRFKAPVFSFANSFSLSNKSNRLAMIKKQKSSSWKRISALTVLPLLGLFFWASATPRYIIQDMPNQMEMQDKKASSKENSKPLIIVDGVEKSYSDMEKINPDQIESIDVLKDKTATRVYGEKGENGVIVITMKKEEVK